MQFNTDLNRENFLSNLIQIYSLFQREKKRYFERISQHIYISSVPKKKRKEKKEKFGTRNNRFRFSLVRILFHPLLFLRPPLPLPPPSPLSFREFFAKRAQAESVALITFVID